MVVAVCLGLVAAGIAILVSAFAGPPPCKADGSNCTDYQMQHGYTAVEPSP